MLYIFQQKFEKMAKHKILLKLTYKLIIIGIGQFCKVFSPVLVLLEFRKTSQIVSTVETGLCHFQGAFTLSLLRRKSDGRLSSNCRITCKSEND